METEYLSVAEAARKVEKTPQYLYYLIKNGKLKAEKYENGYKINEEDLSNVFSNNDDNKSFGKNLADIVQIFDKTVEELREQLREKDQQIQQLHTILAISQRNMESFQLALESGKNYGFWRRLLGRKNKEK